jgi:Xaa-Pro aminopeptidase
MDGLPWGLGRKLAASLKDVEFMSGDRALLGARARKTEWELAKMRRAGELHRICLEEILPDGLRPGMTERDCAIRAWDVFFEHGHSGLMRMGAFGEEIFLGHVSAGESGNYPSAFNGPLGLRGDSPAVPFMGNADVIWDGKRPLSCDIGFCLEGYHTDKTSVYWGPDHDVPEEAARAHDFCIEVQAWLADNAVPGATPADLYRPCAERAEKEGFAEGFMALGGNNVPFVGHGIGLVIDEYPPLAERFEEPLEAGMCLAIEPKIGIPGLGMVGTENTFEVREGGAKCLTGENFEILRTRRY